MHAKWFPLVLKCMFTGSILRILLYKTGYRHRDESTTMLLVNTMYNFPMQLYDSAVKRKVQVTVED